MPTLLLRTARTLAVLVAALCALAALPALQVRAAGPAHDRTAVLVVDTSGSMAGPHLAAARSAAAAYLSALPPDVRVGLLGFSSASHTLARPTTDRNAVRHALAALRAGGKTGLYDAVLAGLRLAGPDGERAVVLVTDGADSSSRTSLGRAVAAVAASGVRLDAARIGSGRHSDRALGDLTAGGGGSLVAAPDATELTRWMAALSTASRTPRPTDPPSAVPSPAAQPGGSHRLAVALALCFVGLLGLIGLALGRIDRAARRRRRDRLVTAYGRRPTQRTDPAQASLYARSPVMAAALRLATRLASAERIGNRLAALLARAGLNLKPAEWLLVQFSVAVGVALLLAVLAGGLWVGLLLGTPLGAGASYAWLNVSAGRRARAFDERLPDALELLAGGLASGFALAQAADSVATRGPQPVADEFRRALAEARLGVALEDVLDKTAARMGSRDLELTVMSIRIQREVGGNLAEVLRATVATMRERAYLRRQVQTLSAEGRLSAYILIALPFGIAGFLAMFRGEYLRPLYTDPIGLLMLAGATVSMLIGVVTMKKIVKVDV